MTQRVFNLERKCNALNAKNRHLTEQQEQQETYSRKENLVVRGINEVPNEETEDMCVAAVKQTFTKNLNIDKDYVDRMIIVRCHRLGRKDNVGTYKRTIIARFMNYNDRKIVWSKRMLLKNSPISISENFSNKIEQRRQLLYPVLKKAKASTSTTKLILKVTNL